MVQQCRSIPDHASGDERADDAQGDCSSIELLDTSGECAGDSDVDAAREHSMHENEASPGWTPHLPWPDETVVVDRVTGALEALRVTDTPSPQEYERRENEGMVRRMCLQGEGDEDEGCDDATPGDDWSPPPLRERLALRERLRTVEVNRMRPQGPSDDIVDLLSDDSDG